MTGVLIQRGNLEIDMHIERKPHEYEDGQLEAKGRGLKHAFLTACRRHQPCYHLDFGFLASRNVRL